MSRYFLLIFGVFCCSTAVIVLKTTQTHPLLVAAYRLLLAGAFLAPFFWRDWKRNRAVLSMRQVWVLVLPGVFLGAHFASWALGARLTVVANASLLINLAPVAMPFFAYWLIRERLTLKEVGGTVLAVSGVAFLSWRDLSVGGENMLGNAICLLSMLTFTLYLVFGRKYSGGLTVCMYVTPVYLIGGVIALAVSAVTLPTIVVANAEEMGRLLYLAVVPTVLGHTILNKSLQYFKGQVVSVVNLHQFVFAATMAFFIYDESPSLHFVAAAVACSTGAVIVVREAERVNVADASRL